MDLSKYLRQAKFRSFTIVQQLFFCWGIVVLCLLLPVRLVAQPAKSNAVAQYIASLKNDSLFRSTPISILVMDAKTKKVIASLNPNTALLPASTLKVVTTGLSLVALGSDYQFHTRLSYDGAIRDSTLYGNIYVVGGGDPTFGSSETIAAPIDSIFQRWAVALKNKGIARIAGDLIADETFFEHEETPESWTWGNMGNYFGTCATGLPFCENAYQVVLKSGKKEGDSTAVRSIYPYIPDAVFSNKIKTGKINTGDNTIIYNSHYSDKHIFTGTIPPKRDSFVIKGSNKIAGYSCIWSFNNYLKRNGVLVRGYLKVLSEEAYVKSPRTLVAQHDSPTLKTIAGITNKKSNNFYAETLLKTIGVQKKQSGSYESSLAAVNFLLDSLKVPRVGFKMLDGSGLSRKDYVSAQFFCHFLYAMYRSKTYSDFLGTLATPGDKGTFERLLLSSPYKNRLHAKSGSMDGVRAYTGYSENPDGTLIFAIIINNFDYKISVLQPKVEKLLQLMVE